MTGKPRLHCFYWLQDSFCKNLGDYLAQIILDELGYRCVDPDYPDRMVANPGRCLLPIGSILSEFTFKLCDKPLDVWGCGWRGKPLPRTIMDRARFHAVRGPGTVSGLGLPENTALGDPALLLPKLRTGHVKNHGRTIVIPHYFCMDQMSSSKRCRLTGCDEMLPSWVIGRPFPLRRRSLRGLYQLAGAWVKRGIPVRTARFVIDRIAGAGFILTGSLHGAILAQAYNVPWAAYNDGYVNVTEKWQDWEAYLGIRIQFVATLEEGKKWWLTEGSHGAIRDLEPLLSAFPYPVDRKLFL